MNNTKITEQLTPLDLLMPRTYVGAMFTFRTTSVDSATRATLQAALDLLCNQLPWLTGRVVPVSNVSKASEGGRGAPGLEIQWNADSFGPNIVDKGVIGGSYSIMTEAGMPSSSIPADIWPVSDFIDDVQFAAGAPVLGVSIFRFGDHQGLGMCFCLHHNVVDAAGFTDVLRLWTQILSTPLAPLPLPLASRSRSERLHEELRPNIPTPSKTSANLLALHPEHSKTPPRLPSSHPACTAKLFKISSGKINALKSQLVKSTSIPTAPTTNTIVCAILWSSITRARRRRSQCVLDQGSQLVTAVNGRRRVNRSFSPAGDPYYGNVVVYSLTKAAFGELSEGQNLASFSQICVSITQSHSSARIDGRYITEVHDLVSGLEDYRTLYPGWDLFNSRDLTITSWADLDLYSMNFEEGLGTPDFIRMRHVEADGVCIIMPKKQEPMQDLEVTVMLRKDDMAFLEIDDIWQCIAS